MKNRRVAAADELPLPRHARRVDGDGGLVQEKDLRVVEDCLREAEAVPDRTPYETYLIQRVKAQAASLAFVSAFIEEAKTSGELRKIFFLESPLDLGVSC